MSETYRFITNLCCMKRVHYSKRMLRKQDCVKFRGHNARQEGSETSGRNRFLPGRMEETGKKVFLPVSSRRKWKKTGRKWKKLEEIHSNNVYANKVLKRSSQILWSNSILEHQHSSVFLKILEFCKVPLTCPILIFCVRPLHFSVPTRPSYTVTQPKKQC